MKKTLTIGAVGMLLSTPALAQKPTIEQVMQELNALGVRVGRLEQIIDGRVGNALRHGHGSGHAELPPVVWIS